MSEEPLNDAEIERERQNLRDQAATGVLLGYSPQYIERLLATIRERDRVIQELRQHLRAHDFISIGHGDPRCSTDPETYACLCGLDTWDERSDALLAGSPEEP